jgi:hypothetical protein
MAPFTPINPGAFVRRGIFDPAPEVDSDVAAGQRPLDPADLLALFAGITASGRANPSSSNFSFPGNASASSLPQTVPWRSPDPARQRYVSRIADQLNRGDAGRRGEVPTGSFGMQLLTSPSDWDGAYGVRAQQGDGDGSGVLPAVLRGSSPGRGDDQSAPVTPVQFRRLLQNVLPRPTPTPDGAPDDYTKIGRGIMDLWKSFQTGGGRPGRETTPDGSDEDPANPSKMTPLDPVFGIIISEMARRYRKKLKPGETPFARSPSITPPEGPDNETKCMKAANGGQLMWENYCRDIAADRSCWEEALQSAQRKRGWCANRFSD